MQKTIRTANAIIEDDQGRILLVKRAAEQEEGGLWSLPGGTVESGETPALTLERELTEEIGCRPISSKLVSNRKVEDATKVVEASYFACRIQGEVTLDPSELSTSEWRKPGELPETMAYGQRQILEDYLNGQDKSSDITRNLQ